MQPNQRKDLVEVEAELDRIGIHRRKLVARIVAGGHELWLPDDVKGADRKTARTLWNSISTNKGNIQVDQNDPKFRNNALSDISKLLQSDHGRTMIGGLNTAPAGGNRTIDIMPTSGGTDNAPKPARGDGHTGTGSVTSMNYGEPASNSMGRKGEKIYDPTYIKLGHELGHASHYLSGTESGSGTVVDPGGTKQDSELWTSQEEYNNITREENPMRTDLGLAPRVYHKGHGDVLRIRKLQPVREELMGRYQKLPINRNTWDKHGDLMDAAEAWINLDIAWSSIPFDELDAAIAKARQDMGKFAKALK